jgi:F-type H+-transporting ATPase subunit b
MLHDPKFWLAVSFSIFVLLMIKFVMPLIIKALDGKVKQIADDIKQAEKMKAEAQKLLKDAQRYYEDSVKQSDLLIKDAQDESKKIIKDYKTAVESEIDKKISSASERIKAQEDRVVREIKTKIVESAVEAIQDNFTKIADDKSLDEATKNSINQINSKLVN